MAALFAGSSPAAIVKDSPAGTLNLFNGLRSLHRVLDSAIFFSFSVRLQLQTYAAGADRVRAPHEDRGGAELPQSAWSGWRRQ